MAAAINIRIPNTPNTLTPCRFLLSQVREHCWEFIHNLLSCNFWFQVLVLDEILHATSCRMSITINIWIPNGIWMTLFQLQELGREFTHHFLFCSFWIKMLMLDEILHATSPM